MSFRDRALDLEWILLDVDGVLTDGRLRYGPRGEEVKVFHVRDGLALKLAQRCGLKVGLLSGRRTEAVLRRARELGLDEVLLGQSDRARALDRFLETHATEDAKIAYMGDDLPDLPVLHRCGIAFAPRDAAPEVREAAHMVVDVDGGRGAVRAMVQSLLEARGEWSDLVDLFA